MHRSWPLDKDSTKCLIDDHVLQIENKHSIYALL